jgi:hydroxyacyl-ACP dehydratase HTD2-like protein with hotdog domain
MFNAHHIHLDKEYCQREEGYPGTLDILKYLGLCFFEESTTERLVHGPLTAQMLLESVIFHFPNIQFSHFNYRATNPLFVNRNLTINGTWTDDQTIQLWCCDGNIIGMVGFVNVLLPKNASI